MITKNKQTKNNNNKIGVCHYTVNFPLPKWVVTKLDTPKSDYQQRTGTKWLVLGLGWG